MGKPLTSTEKRPRLKAMASSSGSRAGSAVMRNGWPCGAGSADSGRVCVLVATVIGRATVEAPVRIRLIVPPARLQVIAKSVASPGPKRAVPAS